MLVRKDKNGNYLIRGGQLIFVCQKSDFFLEEADMWRNEVWQMIKERQDLHFTIMTRRIKRARYALPNDWENGYPNVTIALSVEDQESLLERVPYLLELKAKEKTLMIAPLLGEIDLYQVFKDNKEINYINCGGENYKNARAIDFNHVLKLSKDSLALGIPFYFFDTGAYLIKDGKKYFIPKEKRYSQAFLSDVSHN